MIGFLCCICVFKHASSLKPHIGQIGKLVLFLWIDQLSMLYDFTNLLFFFLFFLIFEFNISISQLYYLICLIIYILFLYIYFWHHMITTWLYSCVHDWQSAGNSSALFLTAAAQNMLCLKLAEEVGVIVSSPWVSWFRAASVPALVSLLLSPFILYNLYPPEIKDTPDAPAMAAKRLEHMGSVTRDEWVMIGTMILAVSLWVFG